MTGVFDPQYVAQMEQLAEENGRAWVCERDRRQRLELALMAIKAEVDGAETVAFHQLRGVLDRVGRICEVELGRGSG